LTSKTTTIRDVARQARVGLGTVSRVINGGTHVSTATNTRVMAAIRRLGFRPNAPARRIRGRAEMVCFLLSNRDVLHAFHARILQGVETYARTIKQHVVFCVVHYDADTPPGNILLPPLLEERGWVDGLILAGTVYPNFLRRIQSMGIPFVAFGNNVFGLDGRRQNFDRVRFDGAKAEYEAARFVIEQGHRTVAFVGDTFYPWVRERYSGYLDAVREARLNPTAITARKTMTFGEYGEWAASCFVEADPRPTAVLAANDEVAYALWRSFRRLNLRIPEDVSLVGFDDREEALLMDPALTTVRVHKEEIGKACMETLLKRLHHPEKPFTARVLPTELIVRGTVRHL